MKKRKMAVLAATFGAVTSVATTALPSVPVEAASQLIVNGGFENSSAGSSVSVNDGWFTTASNGKFELYGTWNFGKAYAQDPNDKKIYEGIQAAELNCDEPASLVQILNTGGNKIYKWGLAHRARFKRDNNKYSQASAVKDTMAVIIGDNMSNAPISALKKTGASNKDIFQKMIEWANRNGLLNTNSVGVGSQQSSVEIYSMPIQNVAVSSPTSYDSMFSKTKTASHNNRWNIWLIKSDATDWFEYGSRAGDGKLAEFVTNPNSSSTVFAFTSVQAAYGDDTLGNLLDGIQFGVSYRCNVDLQGGEGKLKVVNAKTTTNVDKNNPYTGSVLEGDSISITASDPTTCFQGFYLDGVFIPASDNRITKSNGEYTLKLDNVDKAHDIKPIFTPAITIKYDPNGGTSGVKSFTFNEANGKAYTSVKPTAPAGWDFINWKLDNANNIFNEVHNATYQPVFATNNPATAKSAKIKIDTFESTDDPTTLLAQWQYLQKVIPTLRPNENQLNTFVENGAGGSVELTIAKDGGQSSSARGNSAQSDYAKENNAITAKATPAQGYKFIGWYDSLSDGNKLSDSETYNYNLPANNTGANQAKMANTAYARFAKIYDVSFNLNNGEGTTPATQTGLIGGDTVNSPTEAAPTRTGYDFAGWSTSPDGTDTWNFDTSTITGATTLYAKWTPKTDTVYTVKHLIQSLDDPTVYTLKEETPKTGTTATNTNATANTYSGYTPQTITQQPIAADGSTVIEIKYDITPLTDNGDGTFTDPNGQKVIKVDSNGDGTADSVKPADPNQNYNIHTDQDDNTIKYLPIDKDGDGKPDHFIPTTYVNDGATAKYHDDQLDRDVIPVDNNMDKKADNVKPAIDNNGDGIFDDEDDPNKKYLPIDMNNDSVADFYMPLEDNGDDTYKDADGNRYIAFDTNDDGIFDSTTKYTKNNPADGTYKKSNGEDVILVDTTGDNKVDEVKKAIDANGDGIYEDEKDPTILYFPVDTDGDGVPDRFVKMTDNGDGSYTDPTGQRVIPVDLDGDKKVDGYKPFNDPDENGIHTDTDNGDVFYVPVDLDKDGKPDQYVKAADNNDGTFTDDAGNKLIPVDTTNDGKANDSRKAIDTDGDGIFEGDKNATPADNSFYIPLDDNNDGKPDKFVEVDDNGDGTFTDKFDNTYIPVDSDADNKVDTSKQANDPNGDGVHTDLNDPTISYLPVDTDGDLVPNRYLKGTDNNDGTYNDANGQRVIPVDMDGNGKADNTKPAIDTDNDGIFEDADDDTILYLPVDVDNDGKPDNYKKVTKNDDGTYTDANGEKFIPVDTDGDGIIDTSKPANDPNNDGIHTDKVDANVNYLPVDKNDDAKPDQYIKAEPIGGGVYKDEQDRNIIPVDTNSDGKADNIKPAIDDNNDGIFEDADDDKIKYIPVDKDGDGTPDNFKKVTDNGDGTFTDETTNDVLIAVDSDADGKVDAIKPANDPNNDGIHTDKDDPTINYLPVDKNGDANPDYFLKAKPLGDGLYQDEQGNKVIPVDTNGDDKADNVKPAIPNGDGTYKDADDDKIKYIPVDKDGDGSPDIFKKVTDNGDGTYTDEQGNKFIPVDTDADGTVDSSKPANDPNEDGVHTDKDDANVGYLPVDKNGDAKPDQYLKADNNGDGTYTDANSQRVIPVDTDGDGKADNTKPAIDDNDDGIFEDADDDKVRYIPVDVDGDGTPDNYKKVTVDKDGNLVDANGNKFIVVDSDADGKVDTSKPANDPNKDGVHTDKEDPTISYLPVDKDGDGKSDHYLKAKDNGDGTFTDEKGNKVIPVDLDGDGVADTIKPAIDKNKDGIFEDKDDDKVRYIPVDVDGDGKPDNYKKVTIDKDGNYVDDKGNKFIVVDSDGDGKVDTSKPANDPNKDGIHTDKKDKNISYLPVDTNGDGKPEQYIQATPNGDGSYKDKKGNDLIPVDLDGDGVADTVKPAYNKDGAGIYSDKDDAKVKYLPIDLDGDGTPDIFKKVNVNKDGSFTDGKGQIYIAVDSDGDGKADKLIFPVKKVGDGIYQDKDGNKYSDPNGDGIFTKYVPGEKPQVTSTGNTNNSKLWISVAIGAIAGGIGAAFGIRRKKKKEEK